MTSLPRISRAGVAFLAVVGLGACSVGSGSSDSDSKGGANSVRIGLVGGVNTLDPHNTRSAGSDLSVLGSVYSSLVTRKGDGSFVPNAATKWSDEGETKWTFTLDERVVFNDGTKLTAETVKWNFDRVLDKANALRWGPVFGNVASVSVTDPKTVVVTLKKPDAEFLATVATFYLMDSTWAGSHKPAQEAMGSGPYVIEQYAPTGDLSLKANPKYWGTKPTVTSVKYSALGDRSALLSALLAREVDVVSSIAPRDSERFAGNKEVTVRTIPSTRAAFVKFNTTKKPFTDVRVRQALNYAVDKEAIIKALFKGEVPVSNGQILTASYDGFQKDAKPYEQDKAKAKALLAEAGVSNLTVEMDVPSGQYIEGENVAQAVAAQLNEVGVDLKINQLPFSTYMDKFVGKNADMAQSIYLTLAADSTGEQLNYFKNGSPYAYWPDTEFVKLLDRARYESAGKSAPERYTEPVNYMREQAPALFLFAQPASYGMSTKLKWEPRSDGMVFPSDMKLDD